MDRDDAVRVRTCWRRAVPGHEKVAVGAPVAAKTDAADEPDARLLLESPDKAAERPHYMPLFVAPQPVDAREEKSTGADDDSDSDDSDSDRREPGHRP